MSTPIESIEILLVEDNPDDVLLIKAALEENNIVNRITHLKDGAEALDYLFHEGDYAGVPKDNSPKVIMLDLNMPKVGGIELLRRIKSNEKTQDIPIVVFTSSKDDPNLKECYRLGVKNYIIKPLDFDQFKKSINKSINGLLMYVSQFRSYNAG
jgi:two-component system response regulator